MLDLNSKPKTSEGRQRGPASWSQHSWAGAQTPAALGFSKPACLQPNSTGATLKPTFSSVPMPLAGILPEYITVSNDPKEPDSHPPSDGLNNRKVDCI